MVSEDFISTEQDRLKDCVKRFFGFGDHPDSISILLPEIERARPSSLVCNNYPLFDYDISPDDVFTALRVYSMLVLLYGERVKAQPPRDLTGPPIEHYVSIGSSVTNKFTAQRLKDQYYKFGTDTHDHDIIDGEDNRYTVLFDGDDQSVDENSRITQDYALITRLSTSGFIEINLSGCRAYGQMAFWYVLKNLEFYSQVLPEVEGKDFQILLQIKVNGKTCTGWDIIDIRPGSDTTTPKRDFPVSRSPETITWLHLSDLHFPQPSDNEIYNSNIVLDALLEDIEKLRIERALSPDFIAVTGDIAYSGHPAQYEQAENFFDKLLGATELEKKQLFIVPGNHDVDRGAISDFTIGAQDALSNQDKVNKFLKNRPERALIFEKLKAYDDFIRTYFKSELILSDDDCYYAKILPIRGKKIAVIGLNSAWMCGLDSAIDHGRGLLLGENQVLSALAQAENADIRVALLHHPLNWLKDFDQNKSKKLLCDRCDFILHGHTHQPEAQQLVDSVKKTVIIATGASYQGREYPNRYNFVQLGASTCKVILRLYSDESVGHWAKDVETYNNAEDGTYDFDCHTLAK